MGTPNPMEEMFEGIDEARMSEGGVYFKQGAYTVDVVACKAMTNRRKIGTFIVECEVVESTCPDLPPGSACSQVITLDKEPALGNIKQFIATAMGCTPKDVTKQSVALVVSEGNPLKGTRLKLSCQNIKTTAGKDFTKHTWKPMTDANPAPAAE